MVVAAMFFSLMTAGCGGPSLPPPQPDLSVLRTEDGKQLADKILAAVSKKDSNEIGSLQAQVVEKMNKVYGKGKEEESDYKYLLGSLSAAGEFGKWDVAEKSLRGIIDRSKR